MGLLYPHFEDDEAILVYLYLCFCPFSHPSFHLTGTNIFFHMFLSNHTSHPLEAWYGTSSRGPTHLQWNTGLSVIYFLLSNLVHFWTLHMIQYTIFITNFSATVTHIHLKLGKVLQLGVLHVSHLIQVCESSTTCFWTWFVFGHFILE